MTIEITEFADVSISVSPVGVASGNFGVLGFLTNEEGVIGTAERTRAYTSLASLGDDWDSSTEVYKAATAFYSQTPTPSDFVVLMCFENPQVATVTGGGHDTHAELTNITAGELNVTIEGVTANIGSLDFSGTTNLDEVASIVQAALQTSVPGVGCLHNGTQFMLFGSNAGASGSITFASGDVSDALGLSQHQGALAGGLDAETPVDALAAAVTSGREFTGLVTHKKYRDVLIGDEGTTTLEIAQWAEAAKKIFCNTTNNLATLSSVINTDIASQLKDATLRFSLTTFSKNPNQYPSASVFGRAASVNFSASNSVITLNLKQMPGVTAEDLTPNEFAVLRSKYASAVVQIGATVNAFTDSRMASGSWLDTTHGLLWLENRCEVDMFNLLYSSNTKIPYNTTGINYCISALRQSLLAAVNNGFCGPGFLPNGTFLPEGFVINSVPLSQVSSGDRSNRIYKGLSFQMIGTGALHEVVVSGEFSE